MKWKDWMSSGPKVFEMLQEKFDLKLIESEPPRELFEFATA